MRILFVHAIGKCKFGGGEKWVTTMASWLRQKGHDVVVGGRSNSSLLEAVRAEGVKTVNFNIFSDVSFYHVIRIARFMRRHHTDVVITRGTDLAVTGMAARLAGNPVVLVRHGLPLRSRIGKHLFLMRKLADGIITNTHSIKELYEHNNWVPPGFTRVVYNGTQVCGWNGGSNGASVSGDGDHENGKHGENDRNGKGAGHVRDAKACVNGLSERFPGKQVVLSVGRLAQQKGYLYLIDAISLIKKKRKDLVLLILGNGKLWQKLHDYTRMRGVEDMVHFEGFVCDVSPYLVGCDLFVLPSLYEGMPNAAMEAMAHGKPVIITAVNGAGELIPDAGKGVLVPPRSPEAIAGAVIRLLDNPQLCLEMGQEARAHVAENFPVKAMVEAMEDYLQEMVQRKSGR